MEGENSPVKKGQLLTAKSSGIIILKWKDNRCPQYFFFPHHLEIMAAKSKESKLMKPECVMDYKL
jgi:hypothetical protein